MSDLDVPGTRFKARVSEHGVTLIEPGTAWSPGSVGSTGNQLVGPIAPDKIAAVIRFLAERLDEYMQKPQASGS